LCLNNYLGHNKNVIFMNQKRVVLIIISFLFIIVPFFINYYSIYKMLSVALGIILLEISFVISKKFNKFIILYLPIIIIILTYGIDYFKTYTFNSKSIYVLESKINNKVSVYNGLFYRVFKCNNEYVLDNLYKKSFVCSTKLLDNIDINKLLSEPKESYKKYKNKFIKVTGKVSQVNGTSSIYLQAYFDNEDNLNGYVKFNETSKLIVKLDNLDVSKYKIYDYITVIGYVSDFEKENQELILTEVKLEDNNLYDNYEIQIIQGSECNNEIKTYTDNLYTHCIDTVYLDYNVDRYELSYVLKDKKIHFEDLIRNAEVEVLEDYKLFRLKQFDILSCSEEKNILINKNTKLDYSWCEE